MKPIDLFRTKAMKWQMLGNWNGIDIGSHARSAQNITEDKKMTCRLEKAGKPVVESVFIVNIV
jgi:hypothetical protein